MTYAICILTAMTLFLLSAIHLFWILGGLWGYNAAIPTIDGKRMFVPGRLITLIVAIFLFLAGLMVLCRGFGFQDSFFLFSLGPWVVVFTFLLRAIGDFRVVGFFKKVRNTKFGYWDTVLFSPLCLGISIFTLGVIIGTT